MKTAIELIAEERQRQIEVEGWTPEHDDHYDSCNLALAAVCYATPPEEREGKYFSFQYLWPFWLRWWKPTPNDRIRELVKSGALIAAEIERLQRLNASGSDTGEK